MKYELDTVYEAFVDCDEGFARLYFVFDYDYCRVTVKDAYDEDWKMYHIGGSIRFTHKCSHGTWKAVLDPGGVNVGVRWEYSKGDGVHFPSISKANDQAPVVRAVYATNSLQDRVEWKGNHYDALIMDDMPIGSSVTAHKDVEKEVKQVIDWHKMMEEGEKKMGLEDLDRRMFNLPLTTANRRRMGIITNITEGGNEMHKELYHVILFNRKTEKIDYKAYITAVGEIEAGMTAAHNYDKYDGKIHKHIVKCIEDSDYVPLAATVAVE